MKNTQPETDANRRSYIRINARQDFCITVIEGTNPATELPIRGNCFCTSSIDISEGGMCIVHDGKLNVGFDVEIINPKKSSRLECLSCQDAFLKKNDLDITPITAKVVWSHGNRCGIKFINLSRYNENVISKFVWDAHISKVRQSKIKSPK